MTLTNRNAVVNDDPKGGRFLVIRPGADAVRVINNLFAGPGELLTGKADSRGNLRTTKADFVNPDKLDYRLRARGVGVGKGIDAGNAYGFSLRPAEEYRHPLGKGPRPSSGPLDLGAHQHTQ